VEIFAAQGAPPVSLTPVANGKNFQVVIMLFGHLWEVEFTHRYIFAFKLNLRSQQPDIVPIIYHRWQICHQYQQHYQMSLILVANLPPVSLKQVANLPLVSLIPVVHLIIGYSWAGGKLIHEKNQKQIS
jgi:hypothetical protein